LSHTPDTTAADNGGTFDPQQAAALLTDATRRARREFQATPPWFLVTRGVLVLVAFGGVWLSVRGQHPYLHPTLAAVPGAVAFGIVNLIASIALARRATAGVTGRSRLRPVEIAAMSAVWVAVFVVMGVLIAVGVSDSIVYGVYPATVPLMAAGLAWAGIMAARTDWRECGIGLGIAVIGAAGALVGPADAWLVVGAGLCVAMLAIAAAIARRQRA
jgi:hypothetical protein